MDLAAAILGFFALAPLAPRIHSLSGRLSGSILSLLPFLLGVYFLSFIPRIASGEVIVATHSWAPNLKIVLSFYLDGLSLTFALLISFIGGIVLIYTGGYLPSHAAVGRLYLLLLSFMGSMLGLVLADNMIAFFVFWELTSLTSFFLIGFDHERESARAGALQALLVTSGGGLALLAGFLLLGRAAGTFEFSELVSRSELIRVHSLYPAMLLLILIGAFTKSAQFPFHFWLPNAMEAPTPVSAYLHSATMVKAGIYLLARLSPALGSSALWSDIVTAVGAVTMLIAAWLALAEHDLKRILAYSTVSALGMMTFMLGLPVPQAAAAMVVFLIGHALYKGALFLVAGAIDHEAGTRDVTRLGALGRAMPLTATAASLAGLSMAGLPPFLGFLGKEAVYGALLESNRSSFVLAAVATNVLFFAISLLVVVRPFFGKKRMLGKVHEASASLWSGPLLLSGLGLVFGLVPSLVEHTLVLSSAQAILKHPVHIDLALWHGVTPELLLSGVTTAGGLAAYGFYRKFGLSWRPLGTVYRFGPERWYSFALSALNTTAKVQTRSLQSGYLRYYLLTIILTVIGLAGSKLLERTDPVRISGFQSPRPYEWALALLILSAALVVVRAESRLAAIAALGVVGYSVALIYVLFGAPDLAMTQFMVETLTVILFVLVFYHLPRFAVLSGAGVRVRDAVITFISGAVITGLVIMATQISLYPKISKYFVDHSVRSAHGRNIVNVILVDFRGLDTLGEITVLALAGIGVFALLKLRIGSMEKK